MYNITSLSRCAFLCNVLHDMVCTVSQVPHVVLSCSWSYMVCFVQYRKSFTLCFFLCNVLHGMVCTVSQVPNVVLSCVMSYMSCFVHYHKSLTLCFLVKCLTWHGVYIMTSLSRCAFVCHGLHVMMCTVSHVLQVVLSCVMSSMVCFVQYHMSFKLCFLV